MKKTIFCAMFSVLTVYGFGQADDPIPLANFPDVVLNLTLPQNRQLTLDGGFLEIEGGIRGIIVVRVDEATYIAYERNCSYQASEACARVDVDISRLFLLDRCCNSDFNLADGYPTKGPASRALRRYATQLSGSNLTVTDEALN